MTEKCNSKSIIWLGFEFMGNWTHGSHTIDNALAVNFIRRNAFEVQGRETQAKLLLIKRFNKYVAS